MMQVQDTMSGLLSGDPCRDPVFLLMNRYDPDSTHAIQVGNLSARLFDDLRVLHAVNDVSRRLLICAALLHDIGWSIAVSGHHKASMNLILADCSIPFTRDERFIVALISRYHRKSAPSLDHPYFASLSSEHQDQVRWCSGILRVADALDRSHQSLVQSVTVDITDHQIHIHCYTKEAESSPFLMEHVPEKKSALLSELSGRVIEVLWN